MQYLICWTLNILDPPFSNETIARMPPPFVNQQGVLDANSQHFSGPPPGILPIFDNGPPQHRPVPPTIIFDGGQLNPGHFHANSGNHMGMSRPPFGEFGAARGSPRGAWRGRGNPFNGRGSSRGGYREAPSGKKSIIMHFETVLFPLITPLDN